jgi:hypothetical protein
LWVASLQPAGKRPCFVGHGFGGCGKIQNAVIPRHAACRGIPLFLCLKPREIPPFVRFTVNAHRKRNDNEGRFFLKLLQSHLIRPQSQRKPSGNNAEKRNLNLSRHCPPGMAGNSAHQVAGTGGGGV